MARIYIQERKIIKNNHPQEIAGGYF